MRSRLVGPRGRRGPARGGRVLFGALQCGLYTATDPLSCVYQKFGRLSQPAGGLASGGGSSCSAGREAGGSRTCLLHACRRVPPRSWGNQLPGGFPQRGTSATRLRCIMPLDLRAGLGLSTASPAGGGRRLVAAGSCIPSTTNCVCTAELGVEYVVSCRHTVHLLKILRPALALFAASGPFCPNLAATAGAVLCALPAGR